MASIGRSSADGYEEPGIYECEVVSSPVATRLQINGDAAAFAGILDDPNASEEARRAAITTWRQRVPTGAASSRSAEK